MPNVPSVRAQACRDANRNLDDVLGDAGGCEYATPLANIADATYLLHNMPWNEYTEEILKYTHRASVLLNRQNLIPSVPRTNSRINQHVSNGRHPDQPQGSCTRGGAGRAGGNNSKASRNEAVGGSSQHGAASNHQQEDLWQHINTNRDARNIIQNRQLERAAQAYRMPDDSDGFPAFTHMVRLTIYP